MKKPTAASDEKTVLSLLDVLGSCLVDIFYNHMYDRAIAVHEKTSRGLTECYRQAIENYLAENKNPRFYSMLLNSLHHYVRMSTIYTTIPYTECINMYASLFVPQMYANSLTTDQRVNLLSMILNNTVQSLAKEIMQHHIGCIIDDHSDATNVEILQDEVLKLLIDERESSYDRFIKAQRKSPPKTKPAKSGHVKASGKVIDEQAITKINAALQRFVSDRQVLKNKNAQLIQKNLTLAKHFNDLKAMFLKQINVQKEQQLLIEELKERLRQSFVQEQKPPVAAVANHETEANDEDDSGESDDDLFSVQYVEEPRY